MIELIALSRTDGWAFVRIEGDVILIKPPYGRRHVSHASESLVEKAVIGHGFAMVHRSYDDWPSLISFLRGEIEHARAELKIAMPDEEMMRELLADASDEILDRFLDRVEKELLPAGERDAALQALTTLISLDSVRHDAQRFTRALALLQSCSKPANGVARDRLNEDILEECFPQATKKFSKEALCAYAQDVSESHQILKVAA
jgi:hypothetical protein